MYGRVTPETAKIALSLTCRHMAEYLDEPESFWRAAGWRAVELDLDRLDRNISRWAEAA